MPVIMEDRALLGSSARRKEGRSSYGVQLRNPECSAASPELTRVRMVFLIRVFWLLALQLGAVAAAVTAFRMHNGVKHFFFRRPLLALGIAIVLIVALIVVVIMLRCWERRRRRFPWDALCLLAFTALEAAALGFVGNVFRTRYVMVGAMLVCAVTTALAIYTSLTCACTCVAMRFGGCAPYVFVTLVAIALGSCSIAFLDRPVKAALSGTAALLFSQYVIFEAQLIVGMCDPFNFRSSASYIKKYSSGDVIFACLNIHCDLPEVILRSATCLKA